MTDVRELLAALASYRATHSERVTVVDEMLALLACERPFSRRQLQPGHFTASAFVCSADRRRVALVHHRRLGRWLQPGGHVEGRDRSLQAAAEREALEETGLVSLAPLGNGILDVDVHPIPASGKEGAHHHYDVRYAFVATDDRLDPSREVLEARWVELSKVEALTSEESVLRCVRALSALG
jgi:8-oxo-dGTP pyrophosphatase MutT (NUDIX family)